MEIAALCSCISIGKNEGSCILAMWMP